MAEARGSSSGSGSDSGSGSGSAWKLNPAAGFTKPSGPVALLILDGVGLGPKEEYNAFHTARTPFLDKLMAGTAPDGSRVLTGRLDASGKSVGLPDMGDMGNSEVGHNAIGAGRVFDQGAKLVNNAFADGSYAKGDVWKWLVEPCAGDDSGTLHLIGLYSDGNVHSHVNHVTQMIEGAIEKGVKRIRLHILADGRDVGEKSALDYIGPLEKRLDTLRKAGTDVEVASGGGRMVVTMDRYEADWAIVQRGWAAHVLGDTDKNATFPSASAAVQHFYDSDPKMTDQYLPPFVLVDGDGKAKGPIQDGDSVLFWNFRGDRAIEISVAFEAPEGEFPHFDRVRVPEVRYAGMMQYDGDRALPKRFLVAPPSIDRTVGEYTVKNGFKRFSISETQKYGHVTYFYNGNRSSKFDECKELYVCIPSYQEREDTRPWMKCAEVTDAAIEGLKTFSPDLIVLNYPNGDMCGHTGSTTAARMGMEAIDLCLSRLVPELLAAGAVIIISADHGNCEGMATLDKKTGKPVPGTQPEGWKPLTSHTMEQVPVLVFGEGVDKLEMNEEARWSADAPECKGAGIVNLGGTVLNLLGLEAPPDFLPSVVKPAASSA